MMKERVTAKRGDNERVSRAKRDLSHPLSLSRNPPCQFTYSRGPSFPLFSPVNGQSRESISHRASIREHSIPSCRRYCRHHFGLVIKPAANVLARLSPLCHSAIFAARTKKRTARTKTARGYVDRQTLISFCASRVCERKDFAFMYIFLTVLLILEKLGNCF